MMLYNLVGLFAVAAVQNAAFTAVSRTRNSADVRKHAYASIASNGIWFLTQIFLWGGIWKSVEAGSYWQIVAYGAVYTLATTLGSCWMMDRMLRTEKGKGKVGASL